MGWRLQRHVDADLDVGDVDGRVIVGVVGSRNQQAGFDPGHVDRPLAARPEPEVGAGLCHRVPHGSAAAGQDSSLIRVLLP